MNRSLCTLICAALAAGCVQDAGSDGDGATDGQAHPMLAPGLTPGMLEARVSRFAPATIEVDAERLETWERQVLAKLIQASDILHEIYMAQVSPRLPEWRRQLANGSGAGQGAALRYFDLMVGPWDRLEHDEPFLNVVPKPPGAGYYPPDLTKAELETWLADHPEDREAFTSYFTVIEREGANLIAVPYSQKYRDRLERAARLLQEAAAIAETRAPSLARFLDMRAAAFLSNDYYASDVAWMDIAGTRIEPTIGPYEVYEDRLMGYKAAFESFVTVADSAATAELAELKDRMRQLEAALPIPDSLKTLDRSFESPIRVVDVVYTAGDARRGVQTIAFNLPNDERVRAAKGSKKVMLRNVMRAKFENILTPIAGAVLSPELAGAVEFRPWFVRVLVHELAHGIGPGNITVDGSATTVNRALQEHYSAIEEAKADAVGLHSLTVLADSGLYSDEFVRQAFASHVADLFRGVRFGTSEAHGKASALQFNYLVGKGAIRFDSASGRVAADMDRLIATNRALAAELLTLQAHGDYAAAGEMLRTYGSLRPQMQQALNRLGDIPVDIRPEYPAAGRVEEWLAGT